MSSIFLRSQSQVASISRRVSRRVRHCMEHHPITTNSFICINLWVAGDVLAQRQEHQQRSRLRRRQTMHPESSNHSDETTTRASNEDELDWLRAAKCAGFGAFFTGPLVAVWYPFLDKVAVSYRVAARYGVWGPPILKILADEFLMSPPTIIIFFGYMSIWEGESWREFQTKISQQFLPSWSASLIAWPPVLLATFRFLPVYAQAPFINVCCIAWKAFLSHRNALQDEPVEDNALLDQPMEDKERNVDPLCCKVE
jgi:hypothetical protein